MVKGDNDIIIRMAGFEPATSCSQGKRATKLHHIRALYRRQDSNLIPRSHVIDAFSALYP